MSISTRIKIRIFFPKTRSTAPNLSSKSIRHGEFARVIKSSGKEESCTDSMNQRDNKSDDELLLLLLVGGAKKRRRRREKEGSGLGQGGSQFPSTPRRWRKMNRVRRSLPSADYFAFLPRRWEKWRDRGMRSFVPGLGFVSPRNRAPDIIASLEIPPSTDLTSGSEFYSYLTILYWLVSFITMLLQGSRGREDWWRSSGITFLEKEEEMQTRRGWSGFFMEEMTGGR